MTTIGDEKGVAGGEKNVKRVTAGMRGRQREEEIKGRSRRAE